MRWSRVLIAVWAVLGLWVVPAPAQGGPDPSEVAEMRGTNEWSGPTPVELLEDGADAVPGFEGGLSGALNVVLLLTVLALAPSIMIMTTCFIRFIIVLGLLKQAMGASGLPPAQVVTALALFMTFLVMTPTLDRMYEEAFVPYAEGELSSQLELWDRAKQPLRDFMFDQIEASDGWSSVYLIMNYRGIDTSEPESLTRADVDMLTLTPAYMLNELKVGFLMGFRVYLPFLIIDMVIASVLISMSMMMLPPVLISLPFKILLFILVDGWNLIVGSLMTSVVAGGVGDGSELSRAGPAGHWAETGLLETVWSAGAAVGLC